MLGAKLASADKVEIRVGETTIHLFPLIRSSKAADAPAGVLYVFPSKTTTTGNAGGRDNMGNICFTEDPNSYFCSVYEIENAWVEHGLFFSNNFPQSWVDFPSDLGTYYVLYNLNTTKSRWNSSKDLGGSCGGWISSDNTGLGVTITDSATNVDSATCENSFPVACCKRMP